MLGPITPQQKDQFLYHSHNDHHLAVPHGALLTNPWANEERANALVTNTLAPPWTQQWRALDSAASCRSSTVVSKGGEVIAPCPVAVCERR
jgi:hypothetical protein